MPPSGVKLSCIEFTLPVVKVVVTLGEQSALGDAEAHLLALHIAAGLVGVGGSLDAGLGQSGVPACSDTTATGRNRSSSAPMTP